MTTAATLLNQFRTLPLVQPAMLGPGPLAILSPHPDDESLACGGLIAASCAAGVPPILILLTDGAASHPGSRSHPPAVLAATRRAETLAAAAALGLSAQDVFFLDQPDGSAPADGAAATEIAARVAAIAAGCTAILTSWRHDPHPDHQAAYAIAAAAARNLGVRLWEFPVWGWTLPDAATLPDADWTGLRLNVARHLPAKRRAVAAHASQHGGLITDAPDGFVLPPDFLALFDGPAETLVSTG